MVYRLGKKQILGEGRDFEGIVGKNSVFCFGQGKGFMELVGGDVSSQRKLNFGRGLGWSCRFGDDQDLGGRCNYEIDESIYGGQYEREREKTKVMRKGECVVIEVKRVKSFINEDEDVNQLLNMVERF